MNTTKPHLLTWATIACILLLCSCNSQNSTVSEEVNVIQVPATVQKNKLNNFQDIFADVEIIPLETTEESLLKSASKVIVTDYIYYLSFPFDLYIYDLNGKFLKLLPLGQGPGELTQVMDFQVMENGDLFVLDYKAINQYDALGNFIKDHKFRTESLYINPDKFGWFNENNYHLWVEGSLEFNVESQNEFFHLHQIKNGKLDSSFQKAFSSTFSSNKFTKAGGSYLLSPSDYDNYIYEITESKAPTRKYFIDFGEFNVDKSELQYGFNRESRDRNFQKIRSSFSSSITNFIVIENYIYFQFVHDGKYQYVFFHTVEEAFYSSPSDASLIDETLPFRIIGHYEKDKKILAIGNPQELLRLLEKNNITLKPTNLLDKRDIETLSRMEKEDNPYLILLSLK